eukprot:448566-Pelagomonas_calceolata.AAC.1
MTSQHASGLYLDLRPFMNRAPFTIRTDCSAARAHQVGGGGGIGGGDIYRCNSPSALVALQQEHGWWGWGRNRWG